MVGGEYEAKRAEFQREAGEAFDRMMRADQEQMITFDQMEDRALEVGGKLQCWLMEKRLADAEKQKATGPAACCPQCRKPLPLGPTPKARSLRGRTGMISFQRHEGYCPSCRKAFFPSGPSPKAGR
jgi:hypothetical protein